MTTPEDPDRRPGREQPAEEGLPPAPPVGPHGQSDWPGAPGTQDQQVAQLPMVLRVSFALWLVAAALVLIGPIRVYGNREAIIDEAVRTDTGDLTPEQMETVINGLLVFGVVLGIVIAALYAWLAFPLRAGRNWARIALTIVGVVGALCMLVLGGMTGTLGGLVGIAAIVLTYVGGARSYFSQPGTPR